MSSVLTFVTPGLSGLESEEKKKKKTVFVGGCLRLGRIDVSRSKAKPKTQWSFSVTRGTSCEATMQSSRFLKRHFRRYAQALVAVSNYTDYLPKCILLTVIFNRAWKLAFCESFEHVRGMIGHVYRSYESKRVQSVFFSSLLPR